MRHPRPEVSIFIESERLSDGSHAYNVLLRTQGGAQMILAACSEKDAERCARTIETVINETTVSGATFWRCW